MPDVNNTQRTQPSTPVSETPPLLLSENYLEDMAAGSGEPDTVPFCGIKPGRWARTQKIVDDILA